MKTSIRSRKFIVGMVLFVAIILLLSISSAYFLNKLSTKTSAILKENHFSVVYARDMSEKLVTINQEITTSYLKSKNPDTMIIAKAFELFDKSLKLEKNNITEVGEDELAKSIEDDHKDFRNSVLEIEKSSSPIDKVLILQRKFENLNQLLMQLSQMNEEAIYDKTNDAKFSAQKATLQMTFIGTICFLIAFGYTFMFSSYFNERFYKLYYGIKDAVSSNYAQRFNITGSDELSEIAAIVNEMAEKINKTDCNAFNEMIEPTKKEVVSGDLDELKCVIIKIKNIEKEASELLLKIENKIQ
jgi:two-component system, NtrC family, sensor histidine kinase KinB